MHDDADRGAQARERRQLVARAHAAREHEQVAAQLLAVGRDEHVEPAAAVGVGAERDRLGTTVCDDRDARAAKGRPQHLAAAAIEVARHRVGAVVHDAHLRAGMRGGEGELEPEHARAEHDDAAPLAHGLEHALGVGEVAQRGDARRQLVVVRHEVPSVLLERGEIAAMPLDAVERRHVRPRPRREHEAVVAELLAGAQPHDVRGTVDRGGGDAEEHAGAGLLGRDAVADDHGVELGVADRVLRHEHAVVRLDVLAGDDGELDGAGPHGGQQLLDEACADGSVADEDDPECAHAGTPASTRRARAAIRETRTTLVLNSGIAETGSTASDVSRFAACSSP